MRKRSVRVVAATYSMYGGACFVRAEFDVTEKEKENERHFARMKTLLRRAEYDARRCVLFEAEELPAWFPAEEAFTLEE